MKEERRCRLRLVADETCRVEADISKKHLRKLVFRDKPNPLLKWQLLHHFYSLQCFFFLFQKLENEICYLLLLYSLGSPKRVTPFFFNARCPSWCNPKLICSPSCNWTWDILWMHKQVNYGSNGWLDGCCVVLHRCQSVSRKASPADSIQHEYISWVWGAPHLAGQLASPASEGANFSLSVFLPFCFFQHLGLKPGWMQRPLICGLNTSPGHLCCWSAHHLAQCNTNK